jgi:L,D-peptidoglycan transpeptidase YkuD (ErfK/YbiS/YcfS/YnhG family)
MLATPVSNHTPLGFETGSTRSQARFSDPVSARFGDPVSTPKPSSVSHHARVQEGVAKSEFHLKGSGFQKWKPCLNTVLKGFTPSTQSGGGKTPQGFYPPTLKGFTPSTLAWHRLTRPVVNSPSFWCKSGSSIPATRSQTLDLALSHTDWQDRKFHEGECLRFRD